MTTKTKSKSQAALRPIYRVGSIVRYKDSWGVVTEAATNHYHPSPTITFLDDKSWLQPTRINAEGAGISAPYVNTDRSIPDVVLAKSVEVTLKGGA